MSFNEDSRVKIPAILHLCKLGYEYLSLKDQTWNKYNIFSEILFKNLKKINNNIEDEKISNSISKLQLLLDNEDLGKDFYETLVSNSNEIRFIDFDNIENNSFNVVTELTFKNDDEEFRPDITILINGIPIVFIEVKKPNNREGVIAERNRINIRFKNKKFQKFINLFQFIIYSNNMEYDNNQFEPIQGAFYSSTSYEDIRFNYFREEEDLKLNFLKIENDLENFILRDTNLENIKYTEEFLTNKDIRTPTNKIISSMLSFDRVMFFLRYGIVFKKSKKGYEKHILRYPQLFALKKIQEKIDRKVNKGVIWHTQGSGKTALAYYSVKYLTHNFKFKKILPKFYFIVDRIDLMNQAKDEFESRGLKVNLIDTKKNLLNDFSKAQVIKNLSGKLEITVVNIQKFLDDTVPIEKTDYNIANQRIYFLDEVHRSYNPKGSFLANLFNSDRDAYLIGLTGTPLIKKNIKTREIFGDYIHKYYYNASIADGYTLRLIREEIENNYRIKLKEILDKIKVSEKNLNKRDVYSHPKFVEPMLDYIITDIKNSFLKFNDSSFGSMVVCDSSDQAKKMYEIFQKKKYKINENENFSAKLILHDIDDKKIRKENTDLFKSGKVNIIFVYNMLLTGFDANRLKKIYIGRLIKSHNLLQTITRVNRPYNKFSYGYVVDFADIQKEFDETNKLYFDELQGELGEDFNKYSNIFKTKDEIVKELDEIKNILFRYDTQNLENFSKQISKIDDKAKALEIKKALSDAKDLYNVMKLYGYSELYNKIHNKKFNQLFSEAQRHIDMLNYKEAVKDRSNNYQLLNVALENVIFSFNKKSEKELIIADKLKSQMQKTRESLNKNIDKNDPKFISLFDELKRIFEKKNLEEISQKEMSENILILQKIQKKVNQLNNENDLLRLKYNGDEKFVRIHKKLFERDKINIRENILFETLSEIKRETDSKILINNDMINNSNFFEKTVLQSVANNFANRIDSFETATANKINNIIVKEYFEENIFR